MRRGSNSGHLVGQARDQPRGLVLNGCLAANDPPHVVVDALDLATHLTHDVVLKQVGLIFLKHLAAANSGKQIAR